MANISDDELLNSMGLDSTDNAGTLAISEGDMQAEAPQVESQPKAPAQEPEVSDAARYLGTSLNHRPGTYPGDDLSKEELQKRFEKAGVTRIGQKIGERADIRDGWIDVDRQLLGDRDIYYPEDWKFRIRPATVEAIRNWSTIDEENLIAMDDVFNEVMKSCVSITTDRGPLPWGNICSWDRFFFLLLVREYTFVHGEKAIKYDEECIECEQPITFELTSQSMMYEVPDPELLRYYDRATRTWHIDPEEYEVNERPITLYVPTLEKDANIKAWLIARIQENRNRKIDNVFLKFASWLASRISKDADIAKKQIREIEMIYKSWDADMFSFMDEVVTAISVTPSQKLIMTCPNCGEEVTSQIRFPGSVRDIFNVSNRRPKFGQKQTVHM